MDYHTEIIVNLDDTENWHWNCWELETEILSPAAQIVAMAPDPVGHAFWLNPAYTWSTNWSFLLTAALQ